MESSVAVLCRGANAVDFAASFASPARTMKFTYTPQRLFALTLCLVACKRQSESAPAPPAPMRPVPAVQPATPTMPAPQPMQPAPPAPTAMPPGVLCTATTADSFHLRSTVTYTSEGPEFPAGTLLGVMAVDGDMTRRAGQMYTVRVMPDGATGHAFLTAGELAANCPPAVREPAETLVCQNRCAAPHQAEHERCLTECTNSGERGSECLDSCQSDEFEACMRQQCHVENPPRMW